MYRFIFHCLASLSFVGFAVADAAGEPRFSKSGVYFYSPHFTEASPPEETALLVEGRAPNGSYEAPAARICNESIARNGIILSLGFEKGFQGRLERLGCCGNALKIVEDNVHAGKSALRTTLAGRFEKSYGGMAWHRRSELVVPASQRQSDVRWYGAGVYIAPGWMEDEATRVIGFLAPKGGEDFLSLSLHQQQWIVETMNGADSFAKQERLRHNLGPAEQGHWTEWVFYVKWSHANDGMLKIWKDGKFALERQGPNIPANMMGAFSVGLHQRRAPELAAAQPTEISAYFDSIRIGGSASSYADVVPCRTSQP